MLLPRFIPTVLTSILPLSHLSPSPAIWKPRPRLTIVFAFSKMVRVIQKEKVVFSPSSARRKDWPNTNGFNWFFESQHELPPKQHRNARSPRGASSPKTCFLATLTTTLLGCTTIQQEELHKQGLQAGVDHQGVTTPLTNASLWPLWPQTITFLTEKTCVP